MPESDGLGTSWSPLGEGCNPTAAQTDPAGFLGNMGTTVNAQIRGRDSVVAGRVLSDGLSWSIGP